MSGGVKWGNVDLSNVKLKGRITALPGANPVKTAIKTGVKTVNQEVTTAKARAEDAAKRQAAQKKAQDEAVARAKDAAKREAAQKKAQDEAVAKAKAKATEKPDKVTNQNNKRQATKAVKRNTQQNQKAAMEKQKASTSQANQKQTTASLGERAAAASTASTGGASAGGTTNMKILDAKNYPITNFKLSTIDRDTLELADGLDAQMTKIDTAFNNLESRFKGIKLKLQQDIGNGKGKINDKTLKSLRGYIDKMNTRIRSCEAANTQMAKAYKADAKAIRDAEKKTALMNLLNSLISEPSISDDTKSLLAEYSKIL